MYHTVRLVMGSTSYKKFGDIRIQGEEISLFYSVSLKDDVWDDFIFSSDRLIYEQSSMWARIKHHEDWKCIRVIFTRRDSIIGGYQILYKNKRIIGRFGYLNRGPNFCDNYKKMDEYFFKSLDKILKQFKIRILLFYPDSPIIYPGDNHFLPNRLIDIDEAHFYIDLEKPEPDLLKNMMRMRRQNVKKSVSAGVRIREGKRSELKLFFDLMLKTCERQCVSPNPSSLNILEIIWDLFDERGIIKLYFTEHNNEVITGCLSLHHKDKFLAWKAGWSGLYPEIKPNDGMHWLLMLKAKELGFKYYDFRGVKVKYYNEIENAKKHPISVEAKSSPTFFKYGFGGKIFTLPDSKIYIPNYLLHSFLKLFYFVSERYPSVSRRISSYINPG